jgi:hypothetical protein
MSQVSPADLTLSLAAVSSALTQKLGKTTMLVARDDDP